LKNTIPVVITHPCTLFREGLRQILIGAQFRPVLTAATVEDALACDPCSTPSCVWLVALEKFDTSSFDSLRRLSMSSPHLTVVVLADCYTPDDVWAALEAGASGFLDHDICREGLIKALELIVLGETVVPAQFLHTVLKRLVGEGTNQAPPALAGATSSISCAVSPVPNDTVPAESARAVDYARLAPHLSNREIAILRLFMKGASNKVIARQLEIAEATVKVHNKAILRKLQLQNRTQAAVWANRHFGDVPNDGGGERER
jgi:two-component system nitrate/nitrite response regulator NarL